MDRYTVMLVPEGPAPVRRFEVRARWLRWLAVGALVGTLALAGLTADWVRLRRQATDVAKLRAEAVTQREQLRGYDERMGVYSEKVRDAEAQLAALREFERRVRVIANLPAPASASTSAAAAPVLGVGGGADDPAFATPPIGVPTGANVRRPQLSGAEAAEPATIMDPVSQSAPLGPTQWARLESRVERLANRTQQQQSSLGQLIEQIRGKAEQLASTPSIWPAQGWLTSRYGNRISPFTGLRDFHAGIDIAAEPGTEIVAPARGRVVFAGEEGALGRVVVLDHGFGTRTRFGHAQDLRVKRGQTIERGQPIASVGNTGRSTGPHLHYAIERNGHFTNPLDYIVE